MHAHSVLMICELKPTSNIPFSAVFRLSPAIDVLSSPRIAEIDLLGRPPSLPRRTIRKRDEWGLPLLTGKPGSCAAPLWSDGYYIFRSILLLLLRAHACLPADENDVHLLPCPFVFDEDDEAKTIQTFVFVHVVFFLVPPSMGFFPSLINYAASRKNIVYNLPRSLELIKMSSFAIKKNN